MAIFLPIWQQPCKDNQIVAHVRLLAKFSTPALKMIVKYLVRKRFRTGE